VNIPEIRLSNVPEERRSNVAAEAPHGVIMMAVQLAGMEKT
jgi:hypothetical protein